MKQEKVTSLTQEQAREVAEKIGSRFLVAGTGKFEPTIHGSTRYRSGVEEIAQIITRALQVPDKTDRSSPTEHAELANRVEVIDAGHKYVLPSYDGDLEQTLTFMKREGDGYPGNVGAYPGTNLQSVIRVCLARVRYLDKQIPHENNIAIICHLRHCLLELEQRAAMRHKATNTSDQMFAAFSRVIELCKKCSNTGAKRPLARKGKT